mgnify:CR=1 FL=1
MSGTISSAGKSYNVSKVVTSQDGANAETSNEAPSTQVTADPVTVKINDVVPLVDNQKVTTSDGTDLSSQLQSSGLQFSTPGTYTVTYDVGSIRVTKVVTVTANSI